MAPRLSIVIATWQCAALLPRCLDSLRAQTFEDWELLVSDGGSTDGTAQLIAGAPRLAWWHSARDGGIYDAWNRALRHASGEYVCFLGADDAWHAPDTLRRMFDAIGIREFDLVSSRACARDAQWRPRGQFGGAFDFDRLARRMMLAHPGLLHRRVLFERHGDFDIRYRIAADLDFLLRLPRDTRTLHLDFVTVDVQDDGISKRRFWQRIRERRHVHARNPRVGPLRAWLYWLDKAWRRPIALWLGLPH